LNYIYNLTHLFAPVPYFRETAEYVTRTLGGVRGALRQLLAEPSTRLLKMLLVLNPTVYMVLFHQHTVFVGLRAVQTATGFPRRFRLGYIQSCLKCFDTFGNRLLLHF